MKLTYAHCSLLAILLVAVIFTSSCTKTQREAPFQIPQKPFQPFQEQARQNQMPGNPLIDHNTYITFSSDGKTWEQGSLIRKSASVPDLIQLTRDAGKFKKDDLLVYFVDALTMAGPSTEQVGIISSSDLGKTWAEQGTIKLSGKKNKGGVVDPSIVQLEDGSLRLYFFGPDITSGDPAKQEGKHKVYSAKSSDGMNFVAEEGTRFEDNSLTDPEVIYFNGKWLMYYSVGASSELATSNDGLNFIAVDIEGGNVGGVPGALALDNGVRLFACGKGIATATSTDGVNFKLEQIDILNTDGIVCDPAAVKLADGKYAMIYKAIEGEQKPQSDGQSQQAQSQFCPDGICDDFEIREGVCSKDCAGVEGWQAKKQVQEVQPEQRTQTIQTQVSEPISVKAINSTYKTVSSKPTGWFKTGQDADIMLAGIDFNNAGGSLLFNHPGNVASDGTHLLLADRNNNRILIWNKLPASNIAPDLVLGQKDFYSNNPGKGLDQLNWPVSVSAANGKIVVADTYNDRILIWNSFPTKNGQSADMEIKDIGIGGPADSKDMETAKRRIGWPWAVWTDGKKLIVASTGSASVLIWNSFPIQNNQAADIVLFAGGKFGTPRSIGSDGKHLLIGDHNAKPNNGGQGNFLWNSFPTKDDEPYDFFVFTPFRMGEKIPFQEGPGQLVQGDIMWGGAFTPDGKFIVVTNKLFIWDSFPENENDAADLVVGTSSAPGEKKEGYAFIGGDGSGAAFADGKLYIGLYNGNKIVAYNELPTKADQKPDFAIGSPDIDTNTLGTNYFANNPNPLTDGKSLFVISNFDHIMHVWKNLPDQSGAKPDFVYEFFPPPQHASIVRNSLVIDTGNRMFVWKKLPLNGETPDVTFDGKISNIDIAKINGVAGDEKYFYISTMENKTYVWEDVPAQNTTPKIIINTALGGAGGKGGGSVYSDGTYITTISTFEHMVKIYRVADLISNPKNPPQPMTVGRPGGMFNLPESALVRNNHLFVADTVPSRVLVWNNVEDAVAGNEPDVVLGAESLTEKLPEIGRDKLFWPSGMDFDGSYLWVGEFKFSGRVLRFGVG
ncbi:hypothetical protein HYU07_01360 [Candidatus Woesearchaeota archaeon]|nr:hypothetical protein [Candidatus Woesearchaeota archaeon]